MLETLDQNIELDNLAEIHEQAADQYFVAAVEAIEEAAATLTPEEREALENTVVSKPGGSSDQGFRYD